MHLYKLMLNRQNKYIKYKNIKEKMYKTNTAMWCNKTCRQKISDAKLRINQDKW